MYRSLLFIPTLAITLGANTAAQTLTNVIPAASSPGYLVTLEGSGLGATTHVRFRAFVGGFVGVRTIDAPAQSVSATRVTALVPAIGSFIPPRQAQAGSPMGEIYALAAPLGTLTTASDFYYYEGTGGFLENAGTATTQANGEQAAISWGIPQSPPGAGNPQFTPLLQNASPGSLAVLFIGLPAAVAIPFDDGLFAIDPSFILSAPAPSVGPGGQTSVSFSIPPLSDLQGLSLAMQWGFIDLASNIELSHGLRANY